MGAPLRCPLHFKEKGYTMEYAEAKAKIIEELTKKLKNKSKFPVAEFSQFIFIQSLDINTIQQIITLCLFVKTSQNI